MAHELELRNNTYSFFEVGQVKSAWHKLGTLVSQAPTGEEAMNLARANFAVESKDIWWDADRPHISGYKANVRADTGTVLGVVSDRYRIIQNKEAFGFMDDLVRDGVVRYETAGVLGIGERAFALMQVKGAAKIADSEQVPYVLLFNSHDGSSALKVCPTSVRVVCNNTVRMALGGSKSLSIRHNSTAQARMKMAAEMMDSFKDGWHKWVDKAQKMVNCKQTEVRSTLEAIYPNPDPNDKVKTMDWNAKIDRIETIYRFHPTQQNIKGTAWGVFNAITYHENHDKHTVRGERSQGTALRLTEGLGDEVMQRAFSILQAA